jgi:hypothetical protein
VCRASKQPTTSLSPTTFQARGEAGERVRPAVFDLEQTPKLAPRAVGNDEPVERVDRLQAAARFGVSPKTPRSCAAPSPIRSPTTPRPLATPRGTASG